jgi:hypothetical protein
MVRYEYYNDKTIEIAIFRLERENDLRTKKMVPVHLRCFPS